MLRAILAFAFALALTLGVGSSTALATPCPSPGLSFPITLTGPGGMTTTATVVLGPETGELETTCSGTFTVQVTRNGVTYTIGGGTFTATHLNGGTQATFSGTLFGRIPVTGTLNFDATTMTGVATATFPTRGGITVTTTFAVVNGELVVTGVSLTPPAHAPAAAAGGAN